MSKDNYRPPTIRLDSQADDCLLFRRPLERRGLFVAAVDLRNVAGPPDERRRVAIGLSGMLRKIAERGDGGIESLETYWRKVHSQDEKFAGTAGVILPFGRPDNPIEMQVAAEGSLAVLHHFRRIQGEPGAYRLADTPKRQQSVQIVRGVHPPQRETEHGMALMELAVGGPAREKRPLAL